MTLKTSRIWGDEMFVVNNDGTIYCTRGDSGGFNVRATFRGNGDGYTFRAGDVVRFMVYGKKDCENVVLTKSVTLDEDSVQAEFFLDGDDTKFGDVISKPTDYWYEVELNPDTKPQTIVGYDEDGAKIFKLFPEGKDVEA
jgi:hypothetical protein